MEVEGRVAGDAIKVLGICPETTLAGARAPNNVCGMQISIAWQNRQAFIIDQSGRCVDLLICACQSFVKQIHIAYQGSESSRNASKKLWFRNAFSRTSMRMAMLILSNRNSGLLNETYGIRRAH